MKLKPYPLVICADCGRKYQTRGGSGISTFHQDICDVCGEDKTVTEPRDYGFPTFPGHEAPMAGSEDLFRDAAEQTRNETRNGKK